MACDHWRIYRVCQVCTGIPCGPDHISISSNTSANNVKEKVTTLPPLRALRSPGPKRRCDLALFVSNPLPHELAIHRSHPSAAPAPSFSVSMICYRNSEIPKCRCWSWKRSRCCYAILVLKKNLLSAASVLVARPTAAAGVLVLMKEKPAGSSSLGNCRRPSPLYL